MNTVIGKGVLATIGASALLLTAVGCTSYENVREQIDRVSDQVDLALGRQADDGDSGTPPSEQPKSTSTSWDPGSAHPTEANVVADVDRGVWAPAPGFRWASDTPGDLRVVPHRPDASGGAGGRSEAQRLFAGCTKEDKLSGYQGSAPQKAMAVGYTGSPGSGKVHCYWTWGQTSAGDAVFWAVANCRKEQSVCYLLAINDRLAEWASGFQGASSLSRQAIARPASTAGPQAGRTATAAAPVATAPACAICGVWTTSGERGAYGALSLGADRRGEVRAVSEQGDACINQVRDWSLTGDTSGTLSMDVGPMICEGTNRGGAGPRSMSFTLTGDLLSLNGVSYRRGR
jgi:hypothetical protein